MQFTLATLNKTRRWWQHVRNCLWPVLHLLAPCSRFSFSQARLLVSHCDQWWRENKMPSDTGVQDNGRSSLNVFHLVSVCFFCFFSHRLAERLGDCAFMGACRFVCVQTSIVEWYQGPVNVGMKIGYTQGPCKRKACRWNLDWAAFQQDFTLIPRKQIRLMFALFAFVLQIGKAPKNPNQLTVKEKQSQRSKACQVRLQKCCYCFERAQSKHKILCLVCIFIHLISILFIPGSADVSRQRQGQSNDAMARLGPRPWTAICMCILFVTMLTLA